MGHLYSAGPGISKRRVSAPERWAARALAIVWFGFFAFFIASEAFLGTDAPAPGQIALVTFITVLCLAVVGASLARWERAAAVMLLVIGAILSLTFIFAVLSVGQDLLVLGGVLLYTGLPPLVSGVLLLHSERRS